MAKLRKMSEMIFAAALWLCALSGVSPAQEALESQIQSLGSQLNGVRGEFGQRLDRIESLIIGRRQAPKDETRYSPPPSDEVLADPNDRDRFQPCCRRVDGYEPCCERSERYVEPYEPCVPALAPPEPDATDHSLSSRRVEMVDRRRGEEPRAGCRGGVGNCGWGARLFEN
jgi:hypothetical protein